MKSVGLAQSTVASLFCCTSIPVLVSELDYWILDTKKKLPKCCRLIYVTLLLDSGLDDGRIALILNLGSCACLIQRTALDSGLCKICGKK